MIRIVLAVAISLGAIVSAFAAEESSSQSDRWSQTPSRRDAPYYRPAPDRNYRPLPPGFHPAPSVRLGEICQTRRMDCDLRRPRPVGSDCECRTPSGNWQSGTVR